MSIYKTVRYNNITVNGFYTYAYLRKDGTPYYIGKGQEYRAWMNHRVNNKGVHTPKNVSCVIIMEQNLSEVGAFALERRYIRWYGLKGAQKIGAARKGKTWDEIYGKEKADKMRALRRLKDLSKT
jgi:hypothetical protein